MTETRPLIAALVLLGQFALSSTPCPQGGPPSTAGRLAPAHLSASRPGHPAPASEDGHHVHGGVLSHDDSHRLGHPSGSAEQEDNQSVQAIVTIPCPCGCSQSSEAGRAPLSVPDFLPPELPAFAVSGAPLIGYDSIVGPAIGPILRVFHVPISV